MSQLRSGPLAPGIAFITGGARGLGNAIACSFAKEGSKGIALIDIQDEKTFNEGKAKVEKYGTKVGRNDLGSTEGGWADCANSASPFARTSRKRIKSSERSKRLSRHSGGLIMQRTSGLLSAHPTRACTDAPL